jgi:hypothetical protein
LRFYGRYGKQFASGHTFHFSVAGIAFDLHCIHIGIHHDGLLIVNKDAGKFIAGMIPFFTPRTKRASLSGALLLNGWECVF